MKRDTTAQDSTNALETFQKDFQKTIAEGNKFLENNLNPDNIKATMQDLLKKLNDMVSIAYQIV